LRGIVFMETIKLQTVIGPDGQVHLDVPSKLPPGPVAVVLVLAPLLSTKPDLKWSEAVGLGKEIWGGEDAQEYVNRLRDEWER